MNDRLAALAHCVQRRVFGEVVDGAAVTQVDVGDDAELGQGIEGAVDGGPMHIGMALGNGGRNHVGGRVRVGRQQRFDDRSSGLGDTSARGPQAVEDVIERWCSHAE